MRDLDAILRDAPIGVAFLDRELRFVRVNARMAAINGVDADAHLGRTLTDVLPDLPGEVAADLRRVLRTGEPLTEVLVSGETPAHPGVRREWLATYWPVHRRGGVEEVGCIVFEVTERRAAQRELRAQSDRYEALLAALSEAGHGMLVLERDGRCVYANAAFEHLSGYAFPELAAMDSVISLVVPEQREEARRRAAMRIEHGLVEGDYQLTIRRRDGEPVHVEVAGVPLSVDSRYRLVVIVRDVTDRRRAEEERERLLARSALMAEASELFDQTLDETATLERVARLCVREMAEACIVVLGDKPGRIRRVAAAAHDPRVERLVVELQLRYPIEDARWEPITAALTEGRSTLIEDLEALLDGTDERRDGLVRSLGARSAMIVPLRARGAIHGFIALGFAALRRPEDRTELLELFQELGRRAALALSTVRLYEERAAVARTLQRSLLPPALPDVPGLQLAARYRAAGEGNEIGGDFYDCFPTADGEWAAVIGDVCGKGAEAAAITALARYAIRAAVVHNRRPAAVLRDLNAAILQHGTDYRFCTVLYVGLRIVDCGVEACVATGGHPLPLLLRADGQVETVGRPGTLLGVLEEPRISQTTTLLRTGDALLMFTDGVTEASPVDEALAPQRLADFVAACAGSDAPALAEAIEKRVIEVQRGRLRDDVAIVVLRVTGGPEAPFASLGEGVAAQT